MELDNRLYECCQKRLIFYKFGTKKYLMYTVNLLPSVVSVSFIQ